MKTCIKCGTQFEKRYCGECARLRAARNRAANPERTKASKRRSEVKYAEKYAAHRKDYYGRTRAERAAAHKQWVARNKERVYARIKAWHVTNRDRVNEIHRQYAGRNKDQAAVRAHNRRGRTQGTLTRGVVKRLFKVQRGLCAACYRPLLQDIHVDHIMPILLGGANEDWNVQLLHSRCNLSKGAKHPIDFMQLRGFLL